MLSHEAKLKAKAILTRLLEYTNKIELAATEHSADEYIEMVKGRQSLFDELEALRGCNPGESSKTAEHTKIDAQLKELAQRIAEREKHHNQQVAAMTEELKKGMRDLSAEKSINAIYANDPYESGTMFSSKN
jgi:hypothetical protein